MRMCDCHKSLVTRLTPSDKQDQLGVPTKRSHLVITEDLPGKLIIGSIIRILDEYVSEYSLYSLTYLYCIV